MSVERSPLVLRKMEATDVDDIVKLGITGSSDPWSRHMFLGEMANPLSHCFVAREMGSCRAVGFICFRNVGEESELLNIGIHPLDRHKGNGRKLMEFYIDFCHERDVKRFYLEVNALNQVAIHLYRSFSYRPVGTRTKFYEGKFDALLMMKEDRGV